jgi:superfamily I DNA/RNA helicase
VALPRPQGKQKEVVALRPEGHAVVLGTAGSGKTTMALHRAAFLADDRTGHGGKTLLVTYNRTLVTYLDHLRPPELQGVDVRNYHRFARGYLGGRGLMDYNVICDEDGREALIGTAVHNVSARRPGEALFQRPLEFFFEEISWMSRHGIDTEEEYIQVERIGRAEARLTGDQRPSMFEVFREYRTLRDEKGKLYDWDDLASAVKRELESDGDARFYRHVVIDEGQDFSPEMIRSLALAIPEGGSLTMFADVAQQIYGRRLSWSDAGLEIDEAWRFEKNYRNSPQIAALGLAIAEMPYYAGEPDMVAPTEFAAEGPMPVLVRFKSADEETAFVTDQAKRAAESGSVAVLVRRHRDEGPFRRAFRNAQRLHREMAVWNPNPGISYGTIHSAKGLEFDTVILPRLSNDHLPDPILTAAVGEEEAQAGDGRLLYVGVTRARQGLIMSHTGHLTQLMPENKILWQERQQ